MYRVRRHGRGWRNRWPFRKWLPQKVDERFCRECGLPYLNGPLPKEVQQFESGDVAAILFPAGAWKRNCFAVRLGRWKPGSGRIYLSEYIPADEVEDLEIAIAQLREYVEELRPAALAQRKASLGSESRNASPAKQRGTRG